MKRRMAVKCLLVLFVALAMIGSTVRADAETVRGKDWEFNLVPLYLWGVSISGSQTIGTNTLPISASFSDIFDSLDTIFTAHFEGVYRNRWGFLAEINYMDLSGSDFPIDVSLKSVIAELGGMYRFELWKQQFDGLLGIRYWDMENTIAPLGLIEFKGEEDWFDPFVGLRWIWGFADNWSLIVRGDIGGFGVGSDFSWQAAGFVDWKPFKNVAFVGGYRALDVDYSDGAGANLFEFDATMKGPLLGVRFTW